jgi:hypothetical protein
MTWRQILATNGRGLSRAARQLVLLLLLIGVSSGSSSAQGLRVAGVVTTLSGQATVARASTPSALALRFKDDLYARDRITTAEKSLVRVLLGGKALLTVRELSVLTLEEGPERATVSLSEGKVALGVLNRRMGPRKAVEVRTPNAIAAVRGTIFLVEILPPPAGGGPPNTLITVARGVVGVTSLAVPGRTEVLVGPGQTYNVAAAQLRTSTADQLTQEFADLQSAPPHQRPPNEFQEALWTQEINRAATASAPELGIAGIGNSRAPTMFGDSALSVVTSISNALSGGGIKGLSQIFGASGGTGGGGGTEGGLGCGGGVGGGAGVGCSGKGQGALHGNVPSR